MAKIIGEMSGELDVKRCYMPGLKIQDECPDCKKTLRWDGNKDYLSFPIFGGNSSVDFHFHCEDCNKEWEVQGSLSIKIAL